MKKLFLFILIIFVSLLFYSCKKVSTISSAAPTISVWVFNVTTYKGVFTDVNMNSLEATDSIGDEIFISFDTIPTGQSTYAITDGTINTSGCYIQVSLVGGGTYRSTEQPNNQVNVTVSEGKITASFANVMARSLNNPDTANVSGTLIQQ